MQIDKRALGALLLAAAWLASNPVHANGRNDEYRLTVFPTYRISKQWTGIGYLGYVNSAEADPVTNYIGTGGLLHFPPRSDLWLGGRWIRSRVVI